MILLSFAGAAASVAVGNGQATAVPLETRCPARETLCPPSNTNCPCQDTVCPLTTTLCPWNPTTCPQIATQCVPVHTECPASSPACIYRMAAELQNSSPSVIPSIQCPRPRSGSNASGQSGLTDGISMTGFSVESLKDGNIMTTSLTGSTMIPVATHCPATSTLCPSQATQCPCNDTVCPLVTTLCPWNQTTCPQVATQCVPVHTECPYCIHGDGGHFRAVILMRDGIPTCPRR